jgi:hypothetical protein
VLISGFFYRPSRNSWIAILLLISLGSAAIFGSISLNSRFLRDWLSAPLMIVAFKLSGINWKDPNYRLQNILFKWDQKALSITQPVFSLKGINKVLEFFYLFCYPMVPAGLAVLYYLNLESESDLYWTAVLIPTYLCYLMIPSLGTLPPRQLETGKRNENPLRSFNLWILLIFSSNINMFPSGHVTASLSAALVLMYAAPAAGWIFLIFAAGIAIGAFSGRYHFAADVIAAAALSLLTSLFVLAFR